MTVVKEVIEYILKKHYNASVTSLSDRCTVSQKSLHILSCSVVLSSLNYCVEAWANTYKSPLQPLCTFFFKKGRISGAHKLVFFKPKRVEICGSGKNVKLVK